MFSAAKDFVLSIFSLAKSITEVVGYLLIIVAVVLASVIMVISECLADWFEPAELDKSGSYLYRYSALGMDTYFYDLKGRLIGRETRVDSYDEHYVEAEGNKRMPYIAWLRTRSKLRQLKHA